MSIHGDLRKQLATFAGDLEKNQNARRRARLERLRLIEEQAGGQVMQVQFSPDVAAVLNGIQAHIQYEKNRYVLPLQQAGDEAQDGLPPVPPSVPGLEAVTSPFVQELKVGLSPLIRPLENHEVPDSLTPPIKYFGILLLEELASLTNETALLGNSNGSAMVMPRLRQVQQALFGGRLQDAMTILRTAYKNNPHSYLLMFLLSQFLYMMNSMGQQGVLAEARDLAQKSLIASDKVTPANLMRYRFNAIVSELGHDPERALVWLRDTGLLEIDHLLQAKGWLQSAAIPLRAWAMLAEIPAHLWDQREFTLLHDLAEKVPGGALLYLYYFRSPLTAYAATRKEPLPLVAQLERLVQVSWLLYNDIAQPLAQLAQTPHGTDWSIRARFTYITANLCPLPTYDQVLMHIALDGRGVSHGYPDQYLRHALDDPHMGYWRLWSGCLSPNRETRLSHLLPSIDTLEDLELHESLNQMLTTLQTYENKLIRRELWNDLLPWMARWQLDHLLAAGTGSNRPRMRFAPTLPPYITFYRRWSEPSPHSVLPSEMIAENAKRGAFASLFEVQAAFEGAIRLIDDPAHGLIAAQKRALAAAKQAHPGKYGNSGIDMKATPALKGLVLGGLLLGGIVAAVHLTENLGQAIGISLVIAGFVGMLGVQMIKPSTA
ncbi:MAG TPA: hypothetical protein VHP58_05260 [Alphaproteobacteria bacterium]|nr:hypothetical protein [Alphaproteobacteria bacterium]